MIDVAQSRQQQTAQESSETSTQPRTSPQPTPHLSPLDRHVILLARIIQKHRELGYDQTLGHVKSEKIAHLAEAHYQADLGRKPVRDAAGPVDFTHFLEVVERGKQLGAFLDRERPSDQKGRIVAAPDNTRKIVQN